MEFVQPENRAVAFNKLFAEYHQRFIRFALTYVDDYMSAEDIVMDAMMYYWENRFQLKSTDNIPAYIFTTIKHKCLNYLREQQRHQMISQELQEHASWKLALQISTLEACDPEELFSKDLQEQVNKALNKLPETTRKLFIMRRFEEKSCREIAQEMNMSVKGVEYHLAKANQLLRKSLKDCLPLLFYLLNCQNLNIH